MTREQEKRLDSVTAGMVASGIQISLGEHAFSGVGGRYTAPAISIRH